MNPISKCSQILATAAWSSGIALTLMTPYSTTADRFYSIDSASRQLVQFDLSEKAFTSIGSLNLNPSYGDFVGSEGVVNLRNGVLFGTLVFNKDGVDSYKFFKINAATGAATFVADVIDGDSDPVNNLAQGLAVSPNGDVWISYSSGAFSTTDWLGTVNTDTGSITFQTAPTGLRAGEAGMGRIQFDSAGGLFAAAIFPNPPEVTMNVYSITSGHATTISSSSVLDGPAFFLGPFHDATAKFISIGIPNYLHDRASRTIVAVDPANGEISETICSIPSSLLLRDLVKANVPDQLSTLTTIGQMWILLTILASRRNSTQMGNQLSTNKE